VRDAPSHRKEAVDVVLNLMQSTRIRTNRSYLVVVLLRRRYHNIFFKLPYHTKYVITIYTHL
jgi:hypothetical protein